MQAIETYYLGPTNTKGPRIVATTGGGHNRLVTNCDSSLDHDALHAHAAKLLKTQLGWNGAMAGGTTRKGMAWVFFNDAETI